MSPPLSLYPERPPAGHEPDEQRRRPPAHHHPGALQHGRPAQSGQEAGCVWEEHRPHEGGHRGQSGEGPQVSLFFSCLVLHVKRYKYIIVVQDSSFMSIQKVSEIEYFLKSIHNQIDNRT